MCQLFALLQSCWPRTRLVEVHLGLSRSHVRGPDVSSPTSGAKIQSVFIPLTCCCLKAMEDCALKVFKNFVTTRFVSSLTASHLEQDASVSRLSHECIISSFG